jgi:uncharacterized membrane protein
VGRDSHKKGIPDGAHPESARESRTLERNVKAIKAWEESLLHGRSQAEQLSDWVTRAFASGPMLLAHVAWFAAWIVVNLGAGAFRPFDPFPFPFLTMMVSLEAIFLTLFVLASQNRLGRQADKRAHLDLQIDLLAEREMTAVLRLLQDIAAHLKVPETVTPEEIRDLVIETDVQRLTKRMNEFDQGEEAAP